MVDGSTLPDELAGEVVRRAACGAGRGRRTPRTPVASATPRARSRRSVNDEPGGEERQGAEVGVLRLDVVGGDLGDEERQQHGADDDPEAELGRSREPQVAPPTGRASRVGSRHPLMLRVRSPAVRAAPEMGPVRVVTDDGVGSATVVAGPVEAPGLLLVHGFGGRQGGLRRPGRRSSRATTGSSRSTSAATARATHPDDARAYSLDRFAADLGRRRRAPTSTICRLLGHSMGGMVVRRFVLAAPAAGRRARVHGHLGRATARSRRRAGGPRGADRHDRRAWHELKRAVRRARPARHRPRTSGCWPSVPASASSATASGRAQSPVMWVTMSIEIVGPARPARGAGRAALPDARDRRRRGRPPSSEPSRDMVATDPRRRARGRARTPATRRSSRTRRLADGDARASWPCVPPLSGAARRAAQSVAGGLLQEARPLDDDAGDAAGGDEAVAVAHRHPEREPAALDGLERRLGRARDRRPRWARGGRAAPGSRRWSCPRRARPSTARDRRPPRPGSRRAVSPARARRRS